MVRFPSHGPSKSQMIRDYLVEHPNARPREVCEALMEHGISLAFIAAVKQQDQRSSKPPLIEATETTAASRVVSSAATESDIKASAIREMAQAMGGRVMPRAIRASLAEKGIEVTLGEIRQVLISLGMRRQRRPPRTTTNS